MMPSDQLASPPDHLSLDAAGTAVWTRVYSSMMAKRTWRREYSMSLGLLSSHCALYLSFAKQVQALRDSGVTCLGDLDSGLAETHRVCRMLLVDFGLVPEARLHVVPLDDDGIDSEISDLCKTVEPEWTAEDFVKC